MPGELLLRVVRIDVLVLAGDLAGVAAPAAGLEDGLRVAAPVFADAGQLALAGPAQEAEVELLSVQPRFLLALLMGRMPIEKLRMSGDLSFGASFSRAFPGP